MRLPFSYGSDRVTVMHGSTLLQFPYLCSTLHSSTKKYSYCKIVPKDAPRASGGRVFEGGVRVRRGGGDHPRNSTIVSAVLSSSVFTVSSSSSSSCSEVVGFLESPIVYYDARLSSICKSAVQQTKNPLTQGFLLPQIMLIMERHLGREGQ